MIRFILAFKNNITGGSASTDIIVSGGTNDYEELNGTYTLVDASATSFNRKWKNTENDWYIYDPDLVGGNWHFRKIRNNSVVIVGPVMYTDEPVGTEWDTTTDEIDGESTITTAWASGSVVINKITVTGFVGANNTGFETLDGEYINDGSNSRFVNGNDVIGTNAVIRWVTTDEEFERLG